MITEVAIYSTEADKYFQKAIYPFLDEMLLTSIPSTPGLTLELAQHSHSSEKHIIVLHQPCSGNQVLAISHPRQKSVCFSTAETSPLETVAKLPRL